MSTLRHWFDLVCDLPPAQREAALRDAGADAAAIADVLELFAAEAQTHERARAPLADLAAQLVATELRAGDVVGAWKLGRELGHGGMGAVFLAERVDGHYSQQAAIKLMRGRRDAQAAARFAHERQLLARLQHPQIARLIDGGATPEGQPWLAMEFVDGMTIERWCRERELGLDARLALFGSVCAVVQYAHRHLVAHCDLKPSNVLVRADGVPVLLDFGIARALGTDAALPPSIGSDEEAARTPLTPRYASPEQRRGELPGLATDIHALGLMLFELVSDTRVPREHDAATAPCPSRAASPQLRWRRRLRGDLDAIVAQACAPEPAARYASAAALADDVARMAAHRPVQARRHDPLYLTSRLLRRRWPLFALALGVLTLAAAFTWRTVQAERRARIEADTAQRATDFMVSVFAAYDSNVNTGLRRELSAREVLDAGRARIDTELARQPAVRARMLEALGNAYRHMNHGATAVPLLREAAGLYLTPAVDDPLAAARCLEATTNAMANGEFPGADTERVAQEALALARRVAEPDSQQVANAWMIYSLGAHRNGHFDAALAAANTTLSINLARSGPETRLPQAYSNRAMILTSRGEYAQALPDVRRSLELSVPDTMGKALRHRRLAMVQQHLGQWSEAEQAWQHALAIAAAMYGDHDAFAVSFRRGMAALLFETGRYDEAEATLQRALDDQHALGGGTELLALRQALAEGRIHAGRFDAARSELADVHARRKAGFGSDDTRTLDAAVAWARAALASGDAGDGVRTRLDEVRARWNRRMPDGSPVAREATLLLARWHLLHADPASADARLQELLPIQHMLDRRMSAQLPALCAWAARQRGDRDMALQQARTHFEQRQRDYGDLHPHTALAALMLARELRTQRDDAAATALESHWRPRLEGFPTDSAYRRALPEA